MQLDERRSKIVVSVLRQTSKFIWRGLKSPEHIPWWNGEKYMKSYALEEKKKVWNRAVFISTT